MLLRLAVAALFGSALIAAGPPEIKTLTIVKPLLNQFEDGPGVSPSFGFGPGQTIFFSFQVSGYKPTPEKKVDLVSTIDVVDPAGVKLIETSHKEVKAELAPEDKDWLPKVREEIQLPPLLLPGTYVIRVAVDDKIAGQSAKTEVPFAVKARRVEPSDTLTARNFRFLRSEEDTQPLQVAAYRPGDRLWARFEIVGFKYGEKNHIHVEYGMSILGPTGKVLYSEPKAAVDDDSTFYPKPYVPGVVSLAVQPKTPAGEYVIQLTATDGVGNQTFEAKYPFKIEQ